MLTKSRVALLFIMLLIVLALVAWRTVDNVHGSLINSELNASEQLKANLVRCDYFSPCEFITKQGTFWLSVNNPPIKAEQWIDFNLQSELKTWRVKEAKIVGKSMFMGRIPVFFKPIDKGLFTAKTLLGACSTSEMIWQLQISVEVNDITEVLLFDFVVRH